MKIRKFSFKKLISPWSKTVSGFPGSFQLLEGLLNEGTGTGYVQAHDAAPFAAEGESVVESQTGLFYHKFLQIVLFHIPGTEIEPQQISRFGQVHFYFGQLSL